MANLVQEVRDHALAHYEDGGWDVIVECYEDSDIAEAICPATTLAEAIEALRPLIEVWADRQADARVEGRDESW